MAINLANNATSKLAGSITAASTAISVQSGEGAKFPAPVSPNWFPVTLIDASGNIEICKCTARSGDILTVSRGQEGTTARAFSAGSRVSLRITKAVLDYLFGVVDPISDFIKTLLNDADGPTACATLGALKASDYTPMTDFFAAKNQNMGILSVVNLDTVQPGFCHLVDITNSTGTKPTSFGTQFGFLTCKHISGGGGNKSLLQVLEPYDGYGVLCWRNYSINSFTWSAWEYAYTTKNTTLNSLTSNNSTTACNAIGAARLADFLLSNNSNGYAAIPTSGGKKLIIQWGKTDTIYNNGSADITFPTTFVSACWSLVTGLPVDKMSAASAATTSLPTRYGFKMHGDADTKFTNGVHWIAIGV